MDDTAQGITERLAGGDKLGQALPPPGVGSPLERPAKHSQLVVELRADRVRRAAAAERDVRAAAAEALGYQTRLPPSVLSKSPWMK